MEKQLKQIYQFEGTNISTIEELRSIVLYIILHNKKIGDCRDGEFLQAWTEACDLIVQVNAEIDTMTFTIEVLNFISELRSYLLKKD